MEYLLSIGSALTLSALGLGLYMALRKQKPIKTRVNLNDQSDVDKEDPYARRSKIYANNEYLKYLFEDILTLNDVFKRGSKETEIGLCLGRLNSKSGTPEWLTYNEVLERMKHFGDGLMQIGLNKLENPYFGIYATNCVEYVIAEYGCYNHSLIVVPLYETLGPNACRYIINKAEITCILCDKVDRVQALVSQSNYMTTLKHIIVTEDIPQSYKSKACSYGIKVYTVSEIEELGKSNFKENLPPKPEDLAVICYTSGTTDVPKGVMLTHENIISNISAVMYQFGDYAPNKSDTMLSFLPLAHMFERCCEAALYSVGAKVAFFSGDIKNITEDMKCFKPTVLPVVPRLLLRIYDKVHSTVKGNKLKEWLLKRAIASKQNEIENRIIRNNSIWDKIVFKSIREGMGGKVRLLVCGSAPMSGTVLEFMRCALGCVICEGYGQTECVCPCTLTFPGEYETGHVGPPVAACSIKLIDLPEMEYYAKDGKGEICVKGPIVFKGYFKDAEKTSTVLDSDGYLHTGDIGQWTECGTLRIIDRKKHIFKLSQGEYIAPEKIESIYSRSQFVAQIFVYGESQKSCLIAIVVPDTNMLTLWCRQNNLKGTIRDLCQHKEVKKSIMNDLLMLGKKEGLNTFEQLKDIYIHPEPFTIDNGLLTPTLKTKRMELQKFFIRQLEDMYRSLD